MNGKERIYAALQRQKTDRIPIMDWDLFPGVLEQITGNPSDVDFVTKMDLDGISVKRCAQITKVDEKRFYDEFGVLRAFDPEYTTAVDFPIKEPADFAKYKMPDPDSEHIYEKILAVHKEIGQEKAVIPRLRDVFAFPRDMLGYENFLMDFYLEPELISDMMEMQIEYSLAVARNVKSIGIGVVAVLDDIATERGLLISPEMFNEQVMPHFNKLIKGFKEMGMLVIKHTDGDIRKILDELVDSGIDCLDPIDPMGHMDIKWMKDHYGDRIALKGNIDCVHTLVDGTLEEVEREVLQCMKDGGGIGHIISSSNSIHSGINPRNYAHMIKCVKEYGVLDK